MAAGLALVLDQVGELPAQQQGHEQSAQGHQDTLGDHVIQVQPAVVPHGVAFAADLQTQQLEGSGDSCTAGAQSVHSGGQGEDEDGNSKEDGNQLAAGVLALGDLLVHHTGGQNFQQSDGGGDGCNEDQEVEQEADHVANHAAHAVQEDVLHGGEQQAGACAVVHTEGCAGRQDHHAGKQREQGVGEGDDQSILLNVLILGQIGAEGDVDAHGQRQGEEHLAGGNLQDVEEALGVGELGEVGLEHELVALDGAGLEGNEDDDADEDHAQCRHGHLAELFDAALNTAHNDDHGDQHSQSQEQDHGLGVIEQIAKEAGALTGEAVHTEDLNQEAHAVAQGHTGQHGVEAQDQEGAEGGHPADDLIFLAQLGVCAHAQTGLTAQSELAHHQQSADENDQDQVDHQEGEAAGGAHLVGEAPQVAQTDG